MFQQLVISSIDDRASINFIEGLSHDQLWKQIDHVLEMMGMNQTLGDLISMNTDFTRPLENVSSCYAFRLNTSQHEVTFINIFDRNRKFADIVKYYYQAFPNNQITMESFRSLLDSTREIIALCIILEKRDFSENDDSTLKFGFTELSDKNGAYMRKMLGLKPDEILAPSYWWYPTRRSDGSNPQCIKAILDLPDSFDWREKNVVTPVKNQRDCGSCWTFATVGAIESAYLIRSEKKYDFDLSEQEVVSCASRNGCYGGSSVIAFDFVRQYGLTSEQQMPYEVRTTSCRRAPTPVAAIRNYCVRSQMRYTLADHVEYLSDDDIRRALIGFGPLYIAVNADRLSRNYRHGVVNDRTCSTKVNHAVLLVGYTPDAWILKNSWGNRWGESGYFRIARGQNMCGINTEIAYPLL